MSLSEGSVPNAPHLLPNRVFNTEFNVSHRADFHMGATHRSLLDALFESEFTNAMFEMATRTTSMVGYLREFADCQGAAEVKAELVEEKREAATLRVELEALRVAYEETGKHSAEMNWN